MLITYTLLSCLNIFREAISPIGHPAIDVGSFTVLLQESWEIVDRLHL